MALVEVDKLSRDLLVKFCCREELFKEEQAEKLKEQQKEQKRGVKAPTCAVKRGHKVPQVPQFHMFHVFLETCDRMSWRRSMVQMD